MKNSILLILLTGCGIFAPLIQHQHEWTIEVTYFGGSKDTLFKSLTVPYDSIPLQLIKNADYKGCLFVALNNCDNLIECNVREYKIISYTFDVVE